LNQVALWIFFALHAPACILKPALDRHQIDRRAQPELRHVHVDGFVLAALDLEGFMPDAYRAVIADAAIEFGPRGQMGAGFRVRLRVKALKAAPVLNVDDAAPVESGFDVQQAKVGVLYQLGDHARHGLGDAHPFGEFPELVHAHADEEDNEGFFGLGGVAAGEDHV
jgi:hypothetical protein